MPTMTIPRRITLAALVLSLVSFAPAPATRAGEVRVVASVPNIGSIASEIGGDRIHLTTIATGTQDAHFVDPKPSYIIKLRKAALLLINGLDLEIGWVPPLAQGARTNRFIPGGAGYVDCSAGIQAVEIPSILSRAEGDVHPYGNPHYLIDPLNAEIVAATIAGALARVDPDSAEIYEERRRRFVRRIHDALFGEELVALVGGAKLAREASAGTLDSFLESTSIAGTPLHTKLGGWLERMRPAKGRTMVTYHKDLSYFANRFGIRVIDFVEPKPGIQPSAKHLEELVGRLQRGEARVILTRPFVEHRSTDYLAKRTGATVITVPLEVGGAREATDYFKLLDFTIDTILEALAGEEPPGDG
jgi:ABC-type Zn uptake system ZnuABC Zn-binding protein ZnuA